MKRLHNRQKALWSDESRICLYHTDGRAQFEASLVNAQLGPVCKELLLGEVMWGAFSSDNREMQKSAQHR